MTELVELATFDSQVDADLARIYLESEGIEAVLFDDGIRSMHLLGPLVPVRLMVLDKDLGRARSALREYKL